MEFETESELINAVAENYLEKPEQDLSAEFEALGQYNEQRFEDIPVNVEFVEQDPYSGPTEMFKDIEENGQLDIYSGGSSPDGMTDKQNLKGRAVHDYFGHYQNDVGFSTEGEFFKWFNQKEEVPDQSEDLLFSEVVGQVALVHYLDDGFQDPNYKQRAVLIDDEIQNAVKNFYLENEAL